MKHDYLWDKTGEDPEIERLENALAAFRYQETAPPELSAKVLPFPTKYVEKTPRRRFSLALPLAFAACAALILILFGVRFQISNDNPAVSDDSAKPSAPQINDAIQKDLIVVQPQILSNKIVENSKNNKSAKRFAAQNTVKNSRVIPAIARQNKTIAKNAEIKTSLAKLTVEERQAYDQLMLALSITGAKLKIVKDKIDGIEEQNIDPKDGR